MKNCTISFKNKIYHSIDNFRSYQSNDYQGLIKKEKVYIDCVKGAQISILANKIATQW